MSMFADVSREGAAPAEDRVMTGNRVLESDYYEGEIKLAYGLTSPGGAKGVALHIEVGGTELRETLYVTSRDGKTTYADKQNPKIQHSFPGLILVDDLCMLTTSKGLKDQATADKMVKLWNSTKRAEELTQVPVLVDLIGKTARFCISKETVDKQSKDSQGEYTNTGETRDQNALVKFLWTDGRTVTEVQSNVPTPVFKEQWLAVNKGKTRNRARGVEGAAGQPGAGSSSPKPLFGTPSAAPMPAPSGMFGTSS